MPNTGQDILTIIREQLDLSEGDPLADEIKSFVDAVRTRRTPAVTAEDGLRVMELSERIRQSMSTESLPA